MPFLHIIVIDLFHIRVSGGTQLIEQLIANYDKIDITKQYARTPLKRSLLAFLFYSLLREGEYSPEQYSHSLTASALL
jgi:hypothetical protein